MKGQRAVIVALALLTGCASSPQALRYTVGSQKPASYTTIPRLYSQGFSSTNGEADDQMARLQLALLDPPSTLELVDRAVSHHKRDLEEQEAARFFTPDKKGKKRHQSSLRDRKLAGRSRDPSLGGKATGEALGLPCLDASKEGAHHGSKSILERNGCNAFVYGAPRNNAIKPGSSHHQDAWAEVRDGLILQRVQHERLSAHLNYLRQKPDTVDYLMARAEPYLHYLVGELKQQGLPTDLILVPMVESAFQTTAMSPKAAAGLWQFMASTGQQYGLHQAQGYDGRYDTHLATQAALRYLRYLNRLFNGDWLLTLAAYNAGEGQVQRAVQANRQAGGGGSFWELSLPLETQNYVVKILVLSKVVSDPSGHGFRPRVAPPHLALARVETRPEVHVSDFIATAGLAPAEFYKLNPAFRPDVKPPQEAHNFLIPLEKAEILMAANMPWAKVYAPRRVVVQPGDTLENLAKRHGVSEFKLSEWNGLSPKSKLKPGQEILVQGV